MPEYLGNIEKMRATLAEPVQYALPVGDFHLPMNELIGQPLKLVHTGRIHCVACGRLTKKSFNQGYCYPCFTKLAQCDSCIVKPELCHFAEGTCREPEWGMAHCMIPHVVYLANSSGLKVGITRHSQIPTRWLDQGATQALPILAVQSRFQSGLAEVIFKDFVADKTDWRAMLKGDAIELDLRAQLFPFGHSGLGRLLLGHFLGRGHALLGKVGQLVDIFRRFALGGGRIGLVQGLGRLAEFRLGVFGHVRIVIGRDVVAAGLVQQWRGAGRGAACADQQDGRQHQRFEQIRFHGRSLLVVSRYVGWSLRSA